MTTRQGNPSKVKFELCKKSQTMTNKTDRPSIINIHAYHGPQGPGTHDKDDDFIMAVVLTPAGHKWASPHYTFVCYGDAPPEARAMIV